MVETNHYNGKDVHIFDFPALFSSCTDDKNNLERLFNFAICEILFYTYIAFISVHKSDFVYLKNS